MDAHKPRMLLAALAASLLTTAALAADSYRWVEPESGETMYSPTPPTDPDIPYVVLRDGVVIRTFEGSERFERPDSEFEAQRRAEEAQRKADGLLMVQFKSFDDIDRAMEAELDNLRYDFNLLDGTYVSLEKSLFEQIGVAADRQRAGLRVTARQTEQIDSIRTRMQDNRRDRAELDTREVRIRQEYDGKRERYRYLLEQSSSP